MEEDKVVQVEAVAGGRKENVRLIHGKAPYQMGDIPGWIDQIIEHLQAIEELCQWTDFNILIVESLISHALEHPLCLLNDTIRVLKQSFPEEPSFKDWHYEGEEEERQKEEERQAQRAKDLDPVRLAESDRKALVLFMDNLKAANFDVTKIVKDLLAGKAEEPIERYKANGSGKPAKAPEVPLTGRTRRGDGKGGQAHASI